MNLGDALMNAQITVELGSYKLSKAIHDETALVDCFNPNDGEIANLLFAVNEFDNRPKHATILMVVTDRPNHGFDKSKIATFEFGTNKLFHSLYAIEEKFVNFYDSILEDDDPRKVDSIQPCEPFQTFA